MNMTENRTSRVTRTRFGNKLKKKNGKLVLVVSYLFKSN